MIDQLARAIHKKHCVICVGLDTRIEYVPPAIEAPREGAQPLDWAAESVLRYNIALMDAFSDFIPAIKVESACYEMYGPAGVGAMLRTIQEARKRGLLAIADIKGSQTLVTARAYADTYIGRVRVDDELVSVFDADFATANAYFGTEGVTPFIDCCAKYDRGVFVLLKGCTAGSAQVQDLELKDGRRLYEKVADLIDLWGSGLVGSCGYSEVGAMIGSYHWREAAELRENHPEVFFFMPADGMSIAELASLTPCFDMQGLGALICSTKQSLCAWKKPEYRTLEPVEAACRMLKEAQETMNLAFDGAGMHFEGGIDFDG